MNSQLSAADQTDRPKSNPIELRCVAGFFGRLAKRIEDLQSETSPSRLSDFMWGHWTAASKLICEALSAGARFDWFPNDVDVLRFEQLLKDSDEKLGPSTTLDFRYPRPKRYLPTIWFAAVFYLTKAHPRFFRSDDPDRFWNPPHSNYPEVSLSLWKRHATIHSDACSLLSTFLYEMADKPTRAEKNRDKPGRRPKRTDADKICDSCNIAAHLVQHPDARRDEVATATGIAKGHVSNSIAWKEHTARQKEARNANRVRAAGGVGDPSVDRYGGDGDDD